MKVKGKIFLALVIFVLLFSQSVYASGESDLLKRYYENKQDAQVLAELAELYKLPVVSVHTRIFADSEAYRLSQKEKVTPEELAYLVGLYESIKCFSQAQSEIRAFLQKDPISARASLLLGWNYYQTGDWENSLLWYQKAVFLAPDNLFGHHGKMLCHIAMGKTELAKQVGEFILSKDPKNLLAGLRMGNLSYAEKKYERALEFYSIAPDDIDCRLGIGLCQTKLGNPNAARPHLLAAYAVYPLNPNLVEALQIVNQAELKDLEAEIANLPSGDESLGRKKARLAQLYELGGNFDKAAGLLKDMLSSDPKFEELLRLGKLYSLAKDPGMAGNYFEKAAGLSPQPRVTRLAAVDEYLGGKFYGQAQSILDRLNSESPGYDIDQRYGQLFSNTGQRRKAREMYKKVAEYYEQLGKSTKIRETLLLAVDVYLNGKWNGEADRLLSEIEETLTDYNSDLRRARWAFSTGNFRRAVEVYEKYPDLPNLQVSKGWAQMKAHRRKDALRTFRGVLRKAPGNKAAREGLSYAENSWKWDFFVIATTVDYDGFQDDRRIWTKTLRFAEKKTVTSISHSRTDVISLSAGGTDYNEDLFGAKVYYQFNPKYAAQLHMLSFQNDDGDSDGATPWGAGFFYFPCPKWMLGAEVNLSKYKIADARQYNLRAGHQFNKEWRADLIGVFGNIRGRNTRSGFSRNTRALKTSIGYLAHSKMYLNFSGWVGTRTALVDSEGIFGYNSLDRYKNSWSISGAYRLASQWKLYAGFIQTLMESDWQKVVNGRLGIQRFDPNHRIQYLNFGVDYLF